MYKIDPSRTDLAYEFRDNPDGPYSRELTRVINRLRIMPMAERHVLVCIERGCRWMLAKIPSDRGGRIVRYEDQVFSDYNDAVWEVFKRRWKTVTGQELA